MSQAWPYPGSRWWKFDFHTHTPASKDTQAWQNAIGTSDEVTPEKWLLKYMAAEIDCVAVTDHNSGAWIDKLKDAYAVMLRTPPDGFRELHIFPGVEISVQGGFHLLTIFGPESASRKVSDLLAIVGYAGTEGDSDGVTRKGAAEVVQFAVDAGALPIPAHADNDKGLLQVLPDSNSTRIDANTIKQVIENPAILAMEITNRDGPSPTLFTQANINWARVLGSDCHSFRGDAIPGSRYTWVKMASPTLEGLRLALLDGNGVSVRRSDEGPFDPFRLPVHFIEAIEIEKARVMGNGEPVKMDLTPYYNALIGGRGTGKSTVVHALRLAYRRQEELLRFDEKSEPRTVFERFRQIAGGRGDRETPGALRGDTEIRISLMRDGVRHRLRWRADGTGVVVEEWDGQGWHASASQAVTAERFPLRLFSQGQIAAMASDNRQALLDVIDGAAADIAAQKQRFEEAKQSFFSLRAKLRELDGKLAGREETQRKLADVQRKLETFAQSHHADVLKNLQQATRQSREVTALLERVGQWPTQIRELIAEQSLDDWPHGVFDAQDDADILAWRQSVEQASNATRQQLLEVLGQFNQTIDQAQQDPRYQTWVLRMLQAKQAYDELKAALTEQGVQDPQAFGRLVQERQQLETELNRFQLWAQDRENLQIQIAEQDQQLLEARQAITASREAFLQAHLSHNAYVRITVKPFGFDARSIERSLRELLGVNDDRFGDDILRVDHSGQPTSGLVHEYLKTAVAGQSLQGLNELKRRLYTIDADLGGHFRNYLQRQISTHPELGDRILTWFPEDDLKIEYSRNGDGTGFTPIEQGSAGQRAAALLAFLLAFGDEPLVLDQPEDDLDNHLIYTLITRQIRENKRRRQIIIVTHNPNIVVNGDAEMVHAFDFGAGQCFVRHRGALQEKAVRDEVCRVMEGGIEAFKKRWARLGRGI